MVIAVILTFLTPLPRPTLLKVLKWDLEENKENHPRQYRQSPKVRSMYSCHNVQTGRYFTTDGGNVLNGKNQSPSAMILKKQNMD